MKRRTILRRSSALGAAALAGCLSDATTEPGDPNESDPGDAGPDEDAETEDSDGVSVASVGVETVASECASGDEDPTADVRLVESETAVRFSGLLTAGTPCHEVLVESAEYDESEDALAIVLATERSDEPCQDCVGTLEYEGTVAFDGGLPDEAAVSYQDVVLGSTATDNGSSDEESGSEKSDGGETPKLTDSAIDVSEVSPGEQVDEADIEFDRDANAVVVEGTIHGHDACQTAKLGSVDYDAEDDELSVDVVTAAADDADDRLCAESIVEIDYAVRVQFENGLPGSATVSHDGRAFVSAGHGSSAASGSASSSRSTSASGSSSSSASTTTDR
ncbi:hypothetical protein ACFQDG_14520 [Natronoarchaeum mannanilyticum]|uniref:hypothetical protein n=1 Tax=Natronoarchaeum mannanilyticum TaxID=926360 RepID=UPI00360FF12A